MFEFIQTINLSNLSNVYHFFHWHILKFWSPFFKHHFVTYYIIYNISKFEPQQNAIFACKQLTEAASNFTKTAPWDIHFFFSLFITPPPPHHHPFVYCVEFYPPPLIASRLMAASGTVQIMGRLAIACNLLKFKVISALPWARHLHVAQQ